MLKFIVCDDNKDIQIAVAHVIDKVMFQNRIVYEKILFSSYNKDFFDLVDSRENKIYILDIEVASKSGIDVARIIRKKDNVSIIIFLTSHLEEGFNVLRGDYMCLSFISKLDNYKKHLERSLKTALSFSNVKTLSFVEKGIIFNIKMDEILFINRDTNARKVIINTETKKIIVNKKLADMYKETGFTKTSRSCIVNKSRVHLFDFKKNIIVFDNLTEIPYLSNSYKGKI